MGWLNICQFIGNVGRDPETRYSPDGGGVTRISVAVSETWKDKAGEKQERTTWVPIVCFGKLSEFVSTYVKKGAQLYIQGRFSTRSYEKNGETKYTTEIIGDKVLLLDRKAASEDRTEKPAAPSPPGVPGDRFKGMEDDIPF